MRYKRLGRSGLRVSEVCLGAMTFGEDWGWGAAKKERQRTFDAFVEVGGNFIDTAIHYANTTRTARASGSSASSSASAGRSSWRTSWYRVGSMVQGRQYVFGETFPLIDDHRA